MEFPVSANSKLQSQRHQISRIQILYEKMVGTRDSEIWNGNYGIMRNWEMGIVVAVESGVRKFKKKKTKKNQIYRDFNLFL